MEGEEKSAWGVNDILRKRRRRTIEITTHDIWQERGQKSHKLTTPRNQPGLYTDESPGLKVDPVVVLVLSLGFIFSVVALHSMSLVPIPSFPHPSPSLPFEPTAIPKHYPN